MLPAKNKSTLKTFLKILLFLFIAACVDPARPEYKFYDKLLYIEAFASTTENASSVVIYQSNVDYVNFRNDLIEDAEVHFDHVDTGERVTLIFDGDRYYPPTDFRVSTGESWRLSVVLSDGRKYTSEVETVAQPVPINGLSASFDNDLVYLESEDRFVPGHTITVDFDDPQGPDYYLWDFRSFEKNEFCAYCEEGVYRNGECIPNYQFPHRRDYHYDYFCETSDCWRIRYNDRFSLFSDELSDGLSQQGLPVADVVLYTRENILVEVQQFAISKAAYDYYDVINDIIDKSGGLNSPPPSAFIGNLVNPEDEEDLVLGRFTAAAAAIERIFIYREDVEGVALESSHPLNVEQCVEVCPVDHCIEGGPCKRSISAPCVEGRFRTGIRPEGWVD